MPTPRIHYYLDNDDDLAACGIEYDGEDNFTDDDSEITCKKCINRLDDYEEEIASADDDDEEETEEEELAPIAVAEPIVINAQYKIIFTLAPKTLDKGSTKEVESTLYYKGDKRVEIRKVCIRENEYDNQIKVYTKPTPYHVFSEAKRVEKYVESYGLMIMPNQNTDEGESTMAAPRNTRNTRNTETPKTPVQAELTLTEKIAAGKAQQAAASAPPVAPPVTIRTPNTPPARPPVTAEQAQQKEPTLARLCKLESTMTELHKNFDSFRPFNRIQELEAEVLKDKEIIAAQASTIDAMMTRLVECEDAILEYVLGGSTPTPAAPQAPAPRTPVAPRNPAREIPAKGTGVKSQYSEAEKLTMLDLFEEGTTQREISDMYGVGSTKAVWHMINDAKKLRAQQ